MALCVSRLSLVLLLLFAAATQALAHDYQAGELHIAHPYSLATPPGAPNGVAYLAIHHRGSMPDRLLSASTPRAKRVQLHQSTEADGMTTMEHISLPTEIKPGGELVLEPGGYHFMLMGLKGQLKADDRVPLILTFEKAGTVEVELAVKGLGEQKPEASHDDPKNQGHGVH